MVSKFDVIGTLWSVGLVNGSNTFCNLFIAHLPSLGFMDMVLVPADHTHPPVMHLPPLIHEYEGPDVHRSIGIRYVYFNVEDYTLIDPCTCGETPPIKVVIEAC